MPDSVDFLRRAEELELAARAAARPEHRAELLEIAGHWRELARAAARLTQDTPPDA